MRCAISATLTWIFGRNKFHPHRIAVLRDFPILEQVEREPDLTEDGFAEILAHMDPRLHPYILTIAFLGLRSGELENIRLEDLRPNTREMQIRGRVKNVNSGRRKAKTEDSTRSIPVEDEAVRQWLEAAVPMPSGRTGCKSSGRKGGRPRG